MLFTTQTINTEDLNKVQEFFNEYDKEIKTVESDKIETNTYVSKYISSLISDKYQKAVEDIENTKIDNRVVRKRTLQQVMQESFFCGANRFGTNFIA